MALFKDLDDLTQNGQKGDWCFMNQDANIALRFGECAFKDLVILPINTIGDNAHWAWNGSKEAPTLMPSILVEAVPDWQTGWHGYLRDGKLITV